MLLDHVAGAPISWGVSEVPGWGHQLDPHRVLTEMRDVGLKATEFGPEGFLPEDPEEKAELLRSYQLAAVGGFVPVVLHVSSRDVMTTVQPALDSFVAAGATVLVLSADSGLTGYDERIVLDDEAWKVLFDNLDRIRDAAGERGVTATLHPHVGTVVEKTAEVSRVLDGSAIALCLDTGHLLIGGTDPARLAADVPERIAHTHFKDVDQRMAERVQQGELTYTQAVDQGMYRPLGRGDVDFGSILRALQGAGYTGWFVMEQDTILHDEPPPGAGPVADVRTSLDHLRDVLTT
jgi:inosose dehydratase